MDFDFDLATIINFSTNEAQFLSHCLEEVAHFSNQIIVSVCDHFFDGTPEDLSILNSIYQAHPHIQFIQYAWSKENFYGQHSTHFWHNLSRLLGFYFLKPKIKTVLFLDVDEIIEGRRLNQWLQEFPIKDTVALRLACYWYFRDPQLRATEVEASPLLVSKAALHHDALFHPHERGGAFHQFKGKKIDFVSKENPFAHHYSWVRSKEELLRKVSSWGHRYERDWKALIEQEFAHPFSGEDFVHGYSFENVEPYLKTHRYSHIEGKATNVIYLTTSDIHKIDLELKFGILN